jgi:hypothetical protein
VVTSMRQSYTRIRGGAQRATDTKIFQYPQQKVSKGWARNVVLVDVTIKGKSGVWITLGHMPRAKLLVVPS